MNLAQITIKNKEEALAELHTLGLKAQIVAGCTNILPNLKSGKAIL